MHHIRDTLSTFASRCVLAAHLSDIRAFQCCWSIGFLHEHGQHAIVDRAGVKVAPAAIMTLLVLVAHIWASLSCMFGGRLWERCARWPRWDGLQYKACPIHALFEMTTDRLRVYELHEQAEHAAPKPRMHPGSMGCPLSVWKSSPIFAIVSFHSNTYPRSSGNS